MSGSSVYEVRMFRERGYKRQRCRYCGEYFWSLREREDCADAPCSDYTFFELSRKLPSLTVEEVRNKFLNFFRKEGHEVIDPYPVVARWRDDLYLTIASIIVFQPHVTSGLMPPPANPLVIAQPCIRLEDIDSVGYTFGRHLTSFIMGGHHAFNYPDRKVYFTHETVEYAMRFFTEEIGLPEDELVFKESWWEGGGNAGPSFEVAAGGLELATLVFMMYESRDGRYVNMPLKIVDTGYGIERIAWFTQGVPTAFHAIYGGLVSEYHSLLGLKEPPEDLLISAVRHAGRLNPKDLTKYKLLKKVVSEETGYSPDDVGEFLDGAVKVYAVLDHVKTASLMLADNIVPSNTGEGYLVRLVLRRIFRLLSTVGGLEEGLIHKLFTLQADYWRGLYPQLLRSQEYIMDVLTHELRKYNALVERAPQIVRKYLRKGSKGLSTNELIEMYDSHGLPPELVGEIAKKEGVDVQIPSDFYYQVASKHSRAPIKKKESSKLPDDVIKALDVEHYPLTELLFHKDSYIREFKAKILGVINGKYLILDRTAFYPEGGGQAADTGEIYFLEGGFRTRVDDVQKHRDIVVHALHDPVPENLKGSEVVGKIDWGRRFSLMRHHTATHMLLGAARRVLGDHVWQAGAEKTPRRGRLDITHYKPVTAKEVKQIEEMVNSLIIEGREVRTQFLPKYEAEKKYGFRLYEGGVILKPVIRVVEIDGWDAEACFGTHVRNTRDVGAFKVVSVDRIADGVVRFEYVAGTEVSEYAEELEEKIRKASKIIGGDLIQRSESLMKELASLRKQLSMYRDILEEELFKDLLGKALNIEGYEVIVDKLGITDHEVIKNVLLRFAKERPKAIVVAIIPRAKGYQVEISVARELVRVLDAGALLKRIIAKIPGTGGGREDHASGFFKVSDYEILRRAVLDVIAEILKNAGRRNSSG